MTYGRLGGIVRDFYYETINDQYQYHYQQESNFNVWVLLALPKAAPGPKLKRVESYPGAAHSASLRL